MSKAVIASVRPLYCYYYAIGRKTLELRKTCPKLDGPFKVYIYCTKLVKNLIRGDIATTIDYVAMYGGKVIGEFVCDTILRNCEKANADIAEAQSCVKRENILEYSGGHEVFGWHVTNLKIYDKPKELSRFVVEGDCDRKNCENCGWFSYGDGYIVEDDCDLAYENIDRKVSIKPLFRPPQSWCYVEDLDDEIANKENST